MSDELHQVEEEINHLQKQLAVLPPGKLIITKYQSRTKWYVSDGVKSTYIPKSQKSFAEQLAKQKYLSLRLEELLKEQQALQSYLRRHSIISNHAEDLLEDSAYQTLLAPYYQLSTQSLIDWSNAAFEHNTNYPEKLIHKCASGIMVRSKSESFIASALYKNQIPFRYECALNLHGTVYYPDFTILHPQTQKIYYWEHFGMMDNPTYSKNAYSKLQIFNDHGIIPFVNLITTYETKDQPLSIDLVEKIVRYYFL